MMCVLFFAPSSDITKDPGIPYLDKVVHGCLFFGFVFLWNIKFSTRLWQITMLAFIFGVCVEFVQEWMGYGRSFDLYDIVADSLGAVCGAIASFLTRKFILESN